MPTSDLRKLAEDYLRFTKNFFPLIQQSALHIYHSALPLSPKSSTFYPMTIWDETLLTRFNRRPETWGAIIQTIQCSSNNFMCMATFGHWIAVAWSDDFVRIYDVVTGAMRLSLGPIDPVEVVTGSPDGSILFCAHREKSITLWDIQTGGLIHSFVVEEARDIAVSAKGRYFFCLFSNEFGKVWEVVRGVVNKVEDAAVRDFSLVTNFCWLETEEQLVVTSGALVEIWDIVAGTILCSIATAGHITGVVYSPELNRLATSSSFGDTITIIDPQTGISSVLHGLPPNLSCFAFSPMTEELVCGMHGGDLRVFSFPTRSWRDFEYPRTPKFLFPVPNGTVVVGSMYYGIQVLSLDDKHTPSPPLASGRIVSALDQGRIIMLTAGNLAHLLEASTFAQLLTVSTPPLFDYHSTPFLSASLKNRVVVYCLQRGHEQSLQLHEFGDKLPEWTREVDSMPSAIAISPGGTRVVTSHDTGPGTCIRVWDAGNGQLQANLLVDSLPVPSDIAFDSETRFYSHHDKYRVPYDLSSSRAPATCTITHHSRQPCTVESSEGEYQVDSSRKWVVRGSKRVFWIPLGYLSSNPDSYCWAGSNSLVLIGEDEVLRVFTFRS